MTYTSGRTMVKSFDRIAYRFDETRSLPDELMSRVVDAVEKTMSAGAMVLDAGVGTGRFALPLQNKGFDVVGADVSMKMMQKAASKGVRNLVRSDVCSLPFKDLAFDYALSEHLIHLIPQWRTALKEIGRVTKKDLISVISEKDPSGAEEMRKMYSESCRRLGFDVRSAGPFERDLPELLLPDSTIRLAVNEQTFDVQKVLDNYESRTLSEQWEVPEEVHRGALKALRETYGKVDAFVGREEIFLVRWSAGRIRAIGRSPD